MAISDPMSSNGTSARNAQRARTNHAMSVVHRAKVDVFDGGLDGSDGGGDAGGMFCRSLRHTNQSTARRNA